MSRIRTPVQSPQTDQRNLGDADRLFVAFEIVDPNEEGAQIGTSGIPPLFLHVNPSEFTENYRKIINRDYTRGGYVEYHWGEELDTIAASGSTGAFISPATGLANLNRRASIAWQRYEDLFALYRNNGNIHDANGNVVYHGGIRILYDGGIFKGYFTNFTVSESADSQMFVLSWNFKVEQQTREVGI